MKFLLKLFFGFTLLLVLAVVVIFGYFGFVPGVSDLLGSNKPRDLGTKYTAADLTSIRNKSQVTYESLPSNISANQSLQRTGSRDYNGQFTAAEITSSMNNQKWIYWPYGNVQVKFNADGSGEISGVLIKDRVWGYASAIGIPGEAIAFAMKYLPANPVFYVKGKAVLSENKVSVFEPQSFEIGRVPMPINMFLSFNGNLVSRVMAADNSEMFSELSKLSDKKSLIVGYINKRLSSIEGFYAKEAKFEENSLIFNGKLNTKIATVN